MMIFPSLTTQNEEQIVDTLSMLDPYCHGFHVDIMDGNFVPHTFGSIELTHFIRQQTQKPLWIHLMVEHPLTYINQLQLHPGDTVTFHIETVKDTNPLLEALEHKQLEPGIALKPETPLTSMATFCTLVGQITIMTVNPGASGQPFIADTYKKIEMLSALRASQECSFAIAIDGGVTLDIAKKLIYYGVNKIAVGSAVMTAPNPVEALKKFIELSDFDE